MRKIYLDDIIMFIKTKSQNKKDLEAVFQTLWENQLFAKPFKCQFYHKSLNFSRHVIIGEGIKPDPEKIAAIINSNQPTDITSLQSFLGIVAFVRKFIPNCSKLIAPLMALLKKNALYERNFEYKKEFFKLKKRPTSAPLLQYPDPQKIY